MDKKIIIGGSILLIVGILIWVFVESNKPQPGQKVDDLGREHVAVGTATNYNSNPPTSGPHFADWKRANVYSTPQEDGYLVHSLEHGYVIMSYNCAKKVTFKRHPELEDRKIASFAYSGSILYRFRIKSGMTVKEVLAHGVEENETTPSGQEATSSASLPQEFKSEDCHKLVDQLISVYEKKGKRKLIVVPRPNLDTKIALTAWTRIDKLADFDQKRIETFIDAYRDQGPERTME